MTTTTDQIAELDARRAALRAEFDAADTTLALQRGQLVRDLVGDPDTRGAIQRAARELGVSWTQVQRLLGEHDARRVRLALTAAGWQASDYTVRAAGGHANVAVVHGEGDHQVNRMNAASALLNALNAVGYQVHDGDLAVDVDGRGPLATLAAGGEIVVTIPDTAPQCLVCGRPGPAEDICDGCSAVGATTLHPDEAEGEEGEAEGA